eukprot:365139-Chlamydomonas_euryale.AAC.6
MPRTASRAQASSPRGWCHAEGRCVHAHAGVCRYAVTTGQGAGRVCACVRACVRACTCVRACLCACVRLHTLGWRLARNAVQKGTCLPFPASAECV